MPKNTDELKVIRNITASKLKNLRICSGMSRSYLANKIDVTHQQLEKYESGANKISSERLYKIAKYFNVDFDYFFGDPVSTPKNSRDRICMEISKNLRDIDSKYLNSVNLLIKSLKESKDD